MRFGVGAQPFDQAVEVDGVALLVQADGDVLKVDVQRHCLALDAQDSLQRLIDDRIGVGGRAIRPDAHARVLAQRHALDQREDFGAGCHEDQFVERLRVGAEVARHERLGELGALSHVESLEACALQNLLGRAVEGLHLLPIGGGDGMQALGADQAGRQRCRVAQARGEVVQTDGEGAPLQAEQQIFYIYDQVSRHSKAPKSFPSEQALR